MREGSSLSGQAAAAHVAAFRHPAAVIASPCLCSTQQSARYISGLSLRRQPTAERDGGLIAIVMADQSLRSRPGPTLAWP
ncbi:MAG: hypothetical protein EB006_08580 [Betaproteobacteria bacterium]|nr:hypothetical protein [Betaproteobacteria bacterium]